MTWSPGLPIRDLCLIILCLTGYEKAFSHLLRPYNNYMGLQGKLGKLRVCFFSCYLGLGSAGKCSSVHQMVRMPFDCCRNPRIIFVAVLWATVTAAVLAFPHFRDSLVSGVSPSWRLRIGFSSQHIKDYICIHDFRAFGTILARPKHIKVGEDEYQSTNSNSFMGKNINYRSRSFVDQWFLTSNCKYKKVVLISLCVFNVFKNI